MAKPVEFRLECTFKEYAQAHEFIKLVMEFDKEQCRCVPTEFTIESDDKYAGGAVVTVASSWGDNIKDYGKMIKKTEDVK